MKKRIASAFSFSVLLPLAGFVVIAMRLGGSARWTAALALFGAGWLCLGLAAWRHRRTRVALRREGRRARGFLRRHARFLAVLTGSLALLYAGKVLFPLENTAFLEQGAEELDRRVRADLRMLPVYVSGLDRAAGEIERRSALFRSDFASLSPDGRRDVLEHWARFLAYAMQLEQIKHVHMHFYQIDPVSHTAVHLRSFLAAYASFVAVFRNMLRVTAVVRENDYLEALLNEDRTAYDIPADAYFALKQQVTHPDNLLRLNVGQAHLHLAKTRGVLTAEHELRLIRQSEMAFSRIYELLGRQPVLFAANPSEFFEKHALRAWLPLQERVAERMGLTRTVERANFIAPAQVEALRPALQPGDILLQRRDGYLSNIGIPGFWPHVALYTGTIEEMDAFFAGLPLPDGSPSPSRYLAGRNPGLYRALSAPTAEGYRRSVLEALDPGIVATALEVSAAADYLAVLRPRLSRAARLAALLRAFSFHGRPYDYDFDFVTDTHLVCSELIYKAYEPGPDTPGLKFELPEIAGRLLLPPNAIARKFVEEQQSGRPQLDFVAFLDGDPSRRRAIRKGAAAFQSSWRRPRWNLVRP